MSKIYDKTAANFKATTVDAKIIDAQKILVRPKGGAIDERVDICDVLGSSTTSSQDCVALQTLDTYYSEYDNSVFTNGIENVGSVYTSSVRFGSSHFPKGVIKKVSLYARDANTATHDCKVNGCYLLAKVYKKATGELVRSHSSTNGKVIVLEKQSGSSERPLNTWEFAGFPSISDDEIIKFIPSEDGETQKANYYFGCAVDDDHTHLDCQEGGDWDFVNNPLAAGNRYLALAKFEGDFYNEVKDEQLKDFEKKFLQSLYTTTNEALFDNNINNESLGVGSIKSFVLERPYITNGTFNEVSWTTTDTLSSTTHLKITLRDKHGKRLKSYTSNADVDFSSAGLKTYKFNEYFDITDDIGSIVFEACDANGVVSTSSQFRVRVIGNAQKPDADGSEVSNNPFIINVIFHGLSASLGGTLYEILNKVIGKTFETVSDEKATVSGEWNAVHFAPANVPHNIPIDKFIIAAMNDNPSIPLYMAVWIINSNDQKTYIGMSDYAITWEAGKDAIWSFNNNPIVVPENYKLEFFLCVNESSVKGNEADAPSIYIHSKYNPNGSGTIRHSGGWHPRCMQATFSSGGHIGDYTHLTDNQREVINELVSNGYVSPAQLNGVKTSLESEIDEIISGKVKTTASQQTTVAWDACRVPSEYIMHTPFSTITMTALSDNTNTPVHLGVVAFDGTNRTKLGVSSDAKTWSNGNELTWLFDNDIIIPRNQSIELYLTLSKEAFEQSLDSCGVTITTGAHGSVQSGNYRENNTWYSPRIITFTMTGASHFTDSSKHLSKEEKAALQQLVQGSIAVREITIIDDDANAVSLLSENYEEIEDEGIVLKFEDSLDNNYLMCSEKDLVDATDYLELDVNINCPEELGKKLVRRYLVIDLRNMEDERNIVTVFPENVKWSSQIPVIQANKFYVISFQRFAKDLVVANVELYLAD